MNQETPLKVSANKTYEGIDILVKLHSDGKYSWGYPTMGYLDTYNKEYMISFMKQRKLKFEIIPAKEEID